MITTEADVLAPFEIWEINFDNVTLKFKRPIVLRPETLDGGTPQECYAVSIENWDFFAYGYNREQVYDSIVHEFKWLWTSIVTEKDERLIDKYLSIKRLMLDAILEAYYG